MSSDPRTPAEKEKDVRIRLHHEAGYSSLSKDEQTEAVLQARKRKQRLQLLRAGKLPEENLTLDMVLKRHGVI